MEGFEVAEQMKNEHILAQWLYAVDPSAKQIFELKTPHEDPSLQKTLLVIVRDQQDSPRLTDPDNLPDHTVLWEIPKALLQDLDSHKTAPPLGTVWEAKQEIPKPEAPPAPAQIGKLHLQNFRCFEERTFCFNTRFNVIIGINGSGKTAVLDAIAHTLQRIVSWFDPPQKSAPPLISEKLDIYRAPIVLGGRYSSEARYPAKIDPQFFLYGVPDIECGWEVYKRENTLWLGTGKTTPFFNIADLVQTLVGHDYHAIPMPLFAYYPSNRRWEGKNDHDELQKDDISRAAGYLNWNDPTLSFRALELWMMREFIIEQQEPGHSGLYKAVKDCILGGLQNQGIEDVQFNGNLNELAVKKQNGLWLPFGSLSHGVKQVMALVADLAIRCARLNPHLGANAPKETGGIVLIDELDLHLHPTWQRRIVDTLRETFPKLQFIATTHSPFIVQSLRPGELIDLDARHGEYYRHSIEEIAEFVMGAENTTRARSA